MIELNGEMFHDDRMFVLHIAKCTVKDAGGGMIETTVWHEDAPVDHGWCLVTYRNVDRYPATRVDHFDSYVAARAYADKVEPTVPRVSLGGRPPAKPLTLDEWLAWKKTGKLKEYDYRELFSQEGTKPRELILTQVQG